jgi:hypothetical protein
MATSNSFWKRIGWVVGIPTAYAIVLRLFFGIDTWKDLFSVMSVSFLFCLPTIVGALTVYLSPVEKVRRRAYTIFFPWIPILLFFAITLSLALEGWACWLMVLPLFLLAASIGGAIGRYFKLRTKKNRLFVSVLVILPILLAPVERMIGAIPGTYEADTSMEIHASREKIWDNITRVKEIPEEQDHGWLTHLGFPRPVKAELDYLGVGARREAVFTNGLIFHETVTAYEHGRKMVFTIKADPHEIPSTTMDEHVVIGGQYFDVLNGTYELESLGPDHYRVHLYSHFKLNTTFNFYASWWARWIMQDIQNNILQVEKERAEADWHFRCWRR